MGKVAVKSLSLSHFTPALVSFHVSVMLTVRGDCNFLPFLTIVCNVIALSLLYRHAGLIAVCAFLFVYLSSTS